jgi:hypothetical protein
LKEASEMKIHPNDEILKDPYPQKIKKNEKSTDREFGAIIKEAIENSSKVDAEDQKPQIMDNIPEIQFNTFLTGEKIPIVDRVEKFLDILDEYRHKLANPQVTLKNIYSSINEMDAEKERLIPVLNSLPDGDGLKDILNQALITSSLEIIRFNRGDYLVP